MANTKSNVNVKIDSDVKERATQLLEHMGIDQTTVIDMFYRQIIVERCLPFQPVAAPTLDEQIIAAALKDSPKRVELGADADDNIIVDKERHPDIYDWTTDSLCLEVWFEWYFVLIYAPKV